MANRDQKASADRAKASAGIKSGAVSRKTAAGSGPAHKSEREQPYHHGDLHQALLLAAKRVADREGLNGLTLRAVAREAGVSHAAPAHHFGDVTGLLSELAAIGFQKFSQALGQAGCSAKSEEEIANGKARAYVAFARDNPCMFQLMFRAERLDYQRPALQAAAANAFNKLAEVVSARRGENVEKDHLTLAQGADIARIWSMVHGFALLRLDGRLSRVLDVLPEGSTEEMLLAEMLKPERSV